MYDIVSNGIEYLALKQMTLFVEAMEVDNVMTVGVPDGDAIT